ncbi:MAG TPA: CarD family transcriptional regulator [Syntrophomonas sp.]|nr:CarD family transcriptional regulator [Syntrophomonas sp.]
MFKVSDYVVYSTTGVCRITAIGKDEYAGNNDTEYYVLHPVYDTNMTIKIPVNNPKIAMRPILTQEEVLSLIAAMPTQETIWIEDNRERNELYKTILKRGTCQEWIKLIKTLHVEKEARLANGKTLTSTDEEIMRAAEKQLHEEFAIALNISPDKVLPYILEHIS